MGDKLGPGKLQLGDNACSDPAAKAEQSLPVLGGGGGGGEGGGGGVWQAASKGHTRSAVRGTANSVTDCAHTQPKICNNNNIFK